MPKFNNIEEKQKFFRNAMRKLDTGLPKEASPDLIKFFVLHVITVYDHDDCWDDIINRYYLNVSSEASLLY